MKISFDREADALLLELEARAEGETVRGKKVAEGVNLLLGDDGRVIAIEVLNLSMRAGRQILDHLEFDLAPPYEPEQFEFEGALKPEMIELHERLQAETKTSKAKRTA